MRSLTLFVLGVILAGVGCSRPDASHQDHSSHAAHGAPAGEARHPLRGVVTDISPDQSALLVKHEAIPGFMKAMTMLLVVSAEDLAKVKKGDTVTGLIGKRGDDWVLDDVKVVAP